ncbi:PFL_4669 family integrating conjugative element protein [Dickeya dianthicola]|uniref:PFL_4669 family integrating conjugative element protein n=1 Tax=Dickeya dianthicola TaxID=204039 RepID=UPI00039D2B7D|nr:TIGR03761 family integrating conjugative element protein [Dickeya dianthicola]MCI4175105.1 TIGR03761 family integrating conjugative element protein [Dickeya dianthicola]MCI4180728.1 TIGR03761 family integrating conjugative element protein [Dickeya dianthicola]MZG45185.1 TIGR03761 family integrating conjugative element protein [Dickeya dianthicola]MZI00490.1 TIGR03761 family integrating conjugative element protein [Dickeya dianthicola]
MSDTEQRAIADGKSVPVSTAKKRRQEQSTIKKRSRSGALKSSLTVELHTHYAIRLWDGRRNEGNNSIKAEKKRRPTIFSMPQVIAVAGVANKDSDADNPYADALLVKLENALEVSSQAIKTDIEELTSILESIPHSLSLTDVRSVSPLNIGVYSHSPLGYRCVWLLVGYDQLALKVFQAFHYGLISRAQRDRYLDNNGYAVRQIYSLVQNYRTFSVTRSDIRAKTPQGINAINRFGHPDPDIMSGKVRSSFSMPLRAGG